MSAVVEMKCMTCGHGIKGTVDEALAWDKSHREKKCGGAK